MLTHLQSMNNKGRGIGSCLLGTVSVWENEKYLEMVGGDGSTTMLMHLMQL